jgi:hypothetical protein
MHFPQEMGRKCFEKHLGTTIEFKGGNFQA